jgi:hypothetical protein
MVWGVVPMMGAVVVIGVGMLSEGSEVVVVVVRELKVDGAKGVAGRSVLIVESPVLFKFPVATSIASALLIFRIFQDFGAEESSGRRFWVLNYL